MMMIELNNLVFSYDKNLDNKILDIQHWQVAKNEQVFIKGNSGEGKSTLLNLLSGILVPNQGTIQVLNYSLDSMNSKQRDQFRAQHIGYVFQQFNLIPYLSILENIELAKQFVRNKKPNIKADELLKNLNIQPSLWHQKCAHLSIGQQQRIAIARAFINEPDILIADEPTSSLDQSNKQAFIDLMQSMSKEFDCTLIFVSHDDTLSQHFDRVDQISDFNLCEGA